MSELNTLSNNMYHSTSSIDDRKPAHKGNSNIIRNKSGEFYHPVKRTVKAYLHKIK